MIKRFKRLWPDYTPISYESRDMAFKGLKVVLLLLQWFEWLYLRPTKALSNSWRKTKNRFVVRKSKSALFGSTLTHTDRVNIMNPKYYITLKIPTVKEFLAPFITLLLTHFHCKISPQSFLRYRKLDHFASKMTKIPIF